MPYIRIPLKMYNATMKYVLLAIFVLFAAQPLQAESCDMQAAQGSAHGQHDMQDDMGSDMDCCDQEPSDNCNSISHCGACTAGVVSIHTSLLSAIFPSSEDPLITATGELRIRFNPPPFRPPIA